MYICIYIYIYTYYIYIYIYIIYIQEEGMNIEYGYCCFPSIPRRQLILKPFRNHYIIISFDKIHIILFQSYSVVFYSFIVTLTM